MSKYQEFIDLHHEPKPLVIGNAWNAKSAQIIEKAGFDAIATSSGAIADSLGYKMVNKFLLKRCCILSGVLLQLLLP